VDFESADGQGTVFRFQIPAAGEEAGAATQPGSRSANSKL